MSDLGIERIVVILDPSGEHRAAVEAAMELAAMLGLPIHAIFVEDEALFDLADLAVASHMGPLSRDLLEAAFKVEAQRSKRLLDAAATQAGVAATFAVLRGRASFRSLGARETDLVVVEGFSRPLAGEARLQSVWASRLSTDGVSVLVVKRQLARHPVIGRIADDMAQASLLRIADPLAKRLAGSVVQLSQEPNGDGVGTDILIRRIAAQQCDIVMLDESRTDPDTCARLISRTQCSVLLLRRR